MTAATLVPLAASTTNILIIVVLVLLAIYLFQRVF